MIHAQCRHILEALNASNEVVRCPKRGHQIAQIEAQYATVKDGTVRITEDDISSTNSRHYPNFLNNLQRHSGECDA